ncbi:MAG: GAF domain-containing protein [Anaerolineales bacterium]|nr:GAF domain-containing protein [Anaerolineales bacterium]
MNKDQTPTDRNDENRKYMESRIKSLFSEQEPPAYASLREVDAMKARIRELEDALKSQETKASKLETKSLQKKQATLPLQTASFPRPKADSETPKPSSRLGRFWNWLTEAHPSIAEIRERNVASLAASFLIVIFLLEIVGVIAQIPTQGLSKALTRPVMIAALPTLLAYGLSRTKWYRTAIFIFSFAFGTLACISMLRQGAEADTNGLVLSFMPLSLIVASAFLSSWSVLSLTALNILALYLTTRTGIVFHNEHFGAQAGIISTLGFVLIVSANFRRRNERQSLQEIRTANDELQTANSALLANRQQLELRVQERTHDLELAADVGRAITEKVGDLSQTLAKATETIRSQFDLYYTQVYLMDIPGRNLVLRAGTGEAGLQLLRRGHRLPLSGNSLNSRAAVSRQPILVDDTQKSANFLPNPLLPLTRSELAVPLIVNDRVLGVLDMQSEQPESFGGKNIPAFQVVAGQLAIAVQNSTLFDKVQEARLEVEEQARRLTASGWQEFLNAVERGEKLGYVFDQNEVLPLVETEAPPAGNVLAIPIQVTGASVGEVRLADDSDRQWTRSEREIVEAVASQMAQHIENLRLLAQAERYRNEAENVSRRLTSEGWKEYLRTRTKLADGYVYNQNQVQALHGNGRNGSTFDLSYPLTVRDETVGELMLEVKDDSDPHANELVAAVIEKLSGHIENLRLLEQAEQKRLELETVATVSGAASTVLDPDQLLQAVVDLTKERFGLYHTHIYLADENWQTLLLAAGAGQVGRALVAQEHFIALDAEKSLVARAARERAAIIVNDVRSQPDFLPNPLLPDTRAELAVPMIVGDKVLGVFDVQSDQTGGFTKEDANVYSTLAAQVAVALQNARLYAEQAATVTQLRELDRLKSSFLANMSHELRTPLNSILGFSDVILEGLNGPLTENMDNDVRLIQKNGQHLLHLINDVLDMAKIESGKMNLNPEKFKVHSVLDEVVSITSTFASDKSLALLIDEKSDREIAIYADNTRLRQVMINLVNNAIKFTERGQVTLLAAPMDGARVLISVKDTGIGISPDELETVFQEFTQVDTSTTRKAGGTGLGLPISRRLVEMHGGRLWAESAGVEGEGSTFFVELPVEARITEVIEKLER